MSEIKCPNCGKTFQVDESSYAVILSQVRSKEFEKDVHEKLEQVSREYQSELKLAMEKLEQAKRDRENEVKLAEEKIRNEMQKALAEKDSEIGKLRLSNSEEIASLKSLLKNADVEKSLAVSEALAKVEKERDQLKNDLKNKDTESKLHEQTLKEKYEGALQLKDEKIEQLKDLKTKLSTKMVGETLEQHCEIEFNKLRATGFQNAYFEKDNEVSASGSKGDFIFREKDENGTEIISIMFEMKNENETTATKHKNEDFLKELDKDRREKNCEYAVLVTMLEADNELYNTGIVDVSYKYPKMYVIRPQFFIPIITLLRNAALNSMKYKNELIAMRNQDIDVTNFEKDMNDWKASWLSTMKNAGKKHLEAIEQINKAIKDLEKTRDALILSDKHLDAAENKLDNLTIKKLTKGNTTMAKKFDEAKRGGGENNESNEDRG
ncbi:DUF2130 domain-containing protein [Candidatus Saccharibacteria bacterium]|nr:DUF2130 domain-containing protein [Candidatus Saccharibacteria bacterium]